MKIYTRQGDQGDTGLLGGHRVSKANAIVASLGSLDELNSVLGVVLAQVPPPAIRELLEPIQLDLFDLGSQVADLKGHTGRVGTLPASRVQDLEQAIDQLDAELPALTAFILPGGSPAGSQLHFARALARRAERDLVACREQVGSAADEPDDRWDQPLTFLNRLADLLFVMARWVNRQKGVAETNWQPRDSK